MMPLVDMHCHLLAGLDDGPRTEEEALAMCRIAYEEGTRAIAAGAHQKGRWEEVTPDRIRQAAGQLAGRLREMGLALTVFPCAEVMAHPEIETSWHNGELLSVADRGQYLLVEMPLNLFIDLSGLAVRLRRAGVRPILAHPERCAALLHDEGVIEQLIAAGCLVQVSSGSVAAPASRQDELALRAWFQRGVVHLIGSDGHSPTRRPPRLAEAYRRIARWAGAAVADRVCSTNGLAVFQGLPLRVRRPEPPRRRWLAMFWS